MKRMKTIFLAGLMAFLAGSPALAAPPLPGGKEPPAAAVSPPAAADSIPDGKTPLPPAAKPAPAAEKPEPEEPRPAAPAKKADSPPPVPGVVHGKAPSLPPRRDAENTPAAPVEVPPALRGTGDAPDTAKANDKAGDVPPAAEKPAAAKVPETDKAGNGSDAGKAPLPASPAAETKPDDKAGREKGHTADRKPDFETAAEDEPEAPEETPEESPKEKNQRQKPAKEEKKKDDKKRREEAAAPPPAAKVPNNSLFLPRDMAPKIIATGRKYTGVPYRFGGTTPKGFDCSGFVQFVFRQHGYALPRMADEQYRLGKKVKKRKELVPGDLVFFSTYEPGASHCGIYLGQDKFLHVSSRRGVRVDRLDDDYWKPRWYGGRHIVK